MTAKKKPVDNSSERSPEAAGARGAGAGRRRPPPKPTPHAREAPADAPLAAKFPRYRMVKTEELVPYESNARTHSDAQISKIVKSIQEFGFTNPILTDGDAGVIAGHGRLIAAQQLGLETVPTIELKHLTAAQRKAYVIADNKLALDAGWDMDLLRLEMADLRDMGFDLDLTGFDPMEADKILGPAEGNTDPDEMPEVQAEAVSRLGDVWLLGRHRLYVADCTDVLPTLMGIDAVVTDPPYGIGELMKGGRNTGHWNNLSGGNKWDATAPDMGAIRSLAPNVVIWGGNYFPVPPSRCWLAWVKTNSVATQADMELAWTSLDAPARCFQGATGGSYARDHPTQKPVGLMRWCIEQLPKAVVIIADPFSGSGTTIIAAEMAGRVCHAIEISPNYVDVAIRRWQAFTGQTATLEADGRTFAAVERARVKAVVTA